MNDFPQSIYLPAPTTPVALLVDGENLSVDHGETILAIARRYGVPNVRRVYGKTAHIAAWAELGFRLMPVRPGKNAADLLLAVEAMSLALRESFHTLIIAATDRDYASLAEHLRELGHEVIGIGEAQAAPCYSACCTVFHELAMTRPVPVAALSKAAPKPPALQRQKLSAVNSGLREKLQLRPAGTSLVTLGNLMKGKSVKEQTEGCTTWRSHLKKHPDLFRIEGSGAQSLVRWIGA